MEIVLPQNYSADPSFVPKSGTESLRGLRVFVVKLGSLIKEVKTHDQ